MKVETLNYRVQIFVFNITVLILDYFDTFSMILLLPGGFYQVVELFGLSQKVIYCQRIGVLTELFQ